MRRVCEYLFSVAYYLLCKLLYVRELRCKRRASSRQTTIQRGYWIGKREDTLIFISLLSLSVLSAD